jgi:rRNA maturation RNase YbeY
MMKVFVHGILHLLGYDHEKSKRQAEEMEKKQEKYLSKIK